MKEVRLNDRIWFGKHKGSRFVEIIKADPAHVEKLIAENKIKLDERTNSYFESRYGRPGRKNFFDIFDQPEQRRDNDINIDITEERAGDNISFTTIFSQDRFDTIDAGMIIKIMVKKLLHGYDNLIPPTQKHFIKLFNNIELRDREYVFIATRTDPIGAAENIKFKILNIDLELIADCNLGE